jgi:signal transduction histidine kinase
LAANDIKNKRSEDPAQTAFDQVVHLAHEIKNSMTSISTFMQLLPSKWHDERFRDTFYPVVNEETQRIAQLVNDMLDLGKRQSAQLTSTNIQDLLENLIASKAPLAEQRCLQFHTLMDVSSPTIRIDRERIKEAIVNLLHNAMEATPKGGHIRIKIKDDRLPNGRPAIRLEIQDSGPGIDQDLQTAIFDPYISTKAEGQQPAGTGLGLYIAKRHIEAHGGSIVVESPPESGALFRVILPVERRCA